MLSRHVCELPVSSVVFVLILGLLGTSCAPMVATDHSAKKNNKSEIVQTSVNTVSSGASGTSGTSGSTQTLAVAANSTITGTTGIIANGIATSTITITLKDANNSAISGTTPTFSATDTESTNGYGTCSVTNDDGISTCALTSTKSETKALSITSPVSKAGDSVIFINGPAAQLVFTRQPGGGTASQGWGTQPKIEIRDAHGNLVTTAPDATARITLTLTTGTGTLMGTTFMNAVGGIADFGGMGLNINLIGADKVLTATKEDKSGAGGTGEFTQTSNSFTISAATPTKLVFIGTSPSSFTATACSGVITIESQDASGNASAVASATSVDLGENGAGTATFYADSDSSCATPLSPARVTISAGSYNVSFRVKHNTAESISLAASAGVASGLSDAAKTVTVNSNDPCPGKATGESCTGGAIYAGIFDGNKYMIMPGGCDGTTNNPTCGGTDGNAIWRTWKGLTGTNADIPDIINIGTGSTPSTQLGDVTTQLIVASASISPDSAAHYCSDMLYGGYDDWYLPSKSELAYIYCKANVNGGSHDVNYPEEDANCASFGGKTSEIPGFTNGGYWSSTEWIDGGKAWAEYFSSGTQTYLTEDFNIYVRCVRHLEIMPVKLVFTGTSPSALTTTVCSDVFTIESQDGNGNATAVGSATNVNLSENGAGTAAFYASSDTTCTGDPITQATIPAGSSQAGFRIKHDTAESMTVTASASVASGLSDATTSVTIASADPCNGKTIGQACTGGALYAGIFGGHRYMIMPGGCDGTISNPTCAGTDGDAIKRAWYGTGGSYVDIVGITNITNLSTPSTQLGDETTPLIVNDSSIKPNSAAGYCYDMVFGGFDDWYLPSKSELAYIYCKASVNGGNHNIGYPQENTNCASLGGKTSEIPGFTGIQYWSSTEWSNTTVHDQYFVNGTQEYLNKTNAYYVRCVRRLD